MARKKKEPVLSADGAPIKREKRYSVSFEHFEAAMLTEANLSYQLFMNRRYEMPLERRQKITAMLRRFVAEMAPDLAEHKEKIRQYQANQEATAAVAVSPRSFTNGD